MLRTRIAPTPSGYLHLGNAFSFLLTWLFAKKAEGQLLLRIDDLDGQRVRPEYLEDIFKSLEWLGIDYDEGPLGVDDFQNQYSQKHRIQLYQEMLDKLVAKEAVFACQCSRKQIQAASPSGIYPGTCRELGLTFDGDHAWRVLVPEHTEISVNDLLIQVKKAHLGQAMGDFVIRRKDGIPAYQIASLADDLHFGINFIIRGEDLLASSAAQLYLSDLLGAKAFSETTFLHHPLLMAPDGQKLSKSNKSPALAGLRGQSKAPNLVYQLTANLLGIPFSKDIHALPDLLEAFDPGKLKFNITDSPVN